MDPLSIVASSITIAQLVHGSLETITKLRRAKPELIAVHNEIADLLVILKKLQDALNSQNSSEVPLAPMADIFQALFKITQKLEQLSKHVAEWIGSISADPQAKSVPQWKLLGVPHYARRYKDELRSLRMSLSNHLAVAGLLSTSQIQLSLQQILLYAQKTDDRGEDIVNILHQRSQPRQHQSTNVMESNQTSQERIDVTSSASFLGPSQILFDSTQLTAISAVGIRTAQFPRTVCTPWCSCVCHSEKRFGTPKALEWILGGLFIGYSGLPVLSQGCDKPNCHLEAQPTSYITYYFPPWFLSRMISVLFTVTPMAGPVVSLKTQRTVPSSSDILTCAKSGDVDKIQLLFEQGLASPFDVDYDSGVTALHLAISHKRIDACRYLLKMNADPFIEDRTAWAAADNAWDKILSGTFPAETEMALRQLFPQTECIERREFTVLHKIVLGLIPTDLATYLSVSEFDIDATDSNGRTALSVAAERGDINTLNILLKYQPNLELASASGATPLHFAACARDPSILKLLLTAGAKVDSVTDWDQTPLIFATAYTQDARHAEILLNAGAQIDFRDRDGITAISWAAIADNRAVASVLIQWQADIENIDKNGDTMMTLCVIMNRPKIFQLLQSVGNHSSLAYSPPMPGKSFLKLVAEAASLDILEVLTQFALCDSSLSDERSLSLREILEQRSDYDEELSNMFDALLRKLSPAMSSATPDQADDEGEAEFVDASETWSM